MTSLPHSLRLGLSGARRNLVPGVILWALGLAMVLSYYRVPVVKNWLDAIGSLKEAYSIPFAFVFTAFFGSIVPWLAAALFTPHAQRSPLRHLPWFMLYWGFSGVQVDFFYQLQAHLFGSGNDWLTIVKKTAVDQFIFSVLIAVPQMTFAYLLIGKDGSIRRVKQALRKRSFLDRAIPVMIANWSVWIPAISIIYLFPQPLILPLANLVLGFWCLLMTFFSTAEEAQE